MSQQSSTPEEVILGFSCAEIMELLTDLGMDANNETATRLKQLVRALGQFEQAMEVIGGPVEMRRAA